MRPWTKTAVLLLSLTLSNLLGSNLPGSASEVAAPNFWDPHHLVAKPDMAEIRTIRFLTEDDYPPFHFMTQDGALTGFDVDLARALCEELRVTCTIQARRWDTLLDALDQKQGDALIASIRIDEENREKLDFTAPYYKSPARFVTRNVPDAPEATPESLRARTVGVEGGSAHEAFLKAYFPDSTRKTYASQKELRDALESGEIDALFGDGVSLGGWIQGMGQNPCCVFRGGSFMDDRFFGEGVGIAVAKDDRDLRDALDYGLATLAAKGVYTEIYLKYFPLGIY
ncbi:transporter substrate-binding domain-containing protein [Methylocapsa palsarum]|uniref:Polar amino acid transport system substrate-binding protein n=1 Tax=Methylocapsa palsarum TaxID=1612308 RepID=A0A1I4BDT8_9HYPH|nr:transporter substrate-binding domain-containing protein [Methylocapsa palsarum]SFK66964.1 polar amino acid transport system substrate-binding protein [Methylocapsa palsarum]